MKLKRKKNVVHVMMDIIYGGNENYKCLKCQVKNCKKCSGNKTGEVCEEFNDNFILNKNNSCICPSNYILDERNNCQKDLNWIEAEYNISDNKSVFDFLLLDKGVQI